MSFTNSAGGVNGGRNNAWYGAETFGNQDYGVPQYFTGSGSRELQQDLSNQDIAANFSGFYGASTSPAMPQVQSHFDDLPNSPTQRHGPSRPNKPHEDKFRAKKKAYLNLLRFLVDAIRGPLPPGKRSEPRQRGELVLLHLTADFIM